MACICSSWLDPPSKGIHEARLCRFQDGGKFKAGEWGRINLLNFEPDYVETRQVADDRRKALWGELPRVDIDIAAFGLFYRLNRLSGPLVNGAPVVWGGMITAPMS